MDDSDDRKPWDQAISGWRSDFARAQVQLERQRDRLLALIGRRVTAAWTGWEPGGDRWFEDIPLVLVLDGGTQLELKWQNWDALSVTWNTLDLTVPPEMLGRPKQWRSSAPAPVAAIVGRAVTGISVVEGPYFSGADLDFNAGLPMHALAGWMVCGLWIATGDTGLHVYNSADANGLSSVPTVRGYEDVNRVTPLATFTGEA